LNWWLAPDGEQWSKEMIREVLEDLVERGLLTARGDTMETRVYGLNRTRAQEMSQFLEELEREQ